MTVFEFIPVWERYLRVDEAGPAEVESIRELKGGGPGETLRRSNLAAYNPICGSASPTGRQAHPPLLLHHHLILVRVLVFRLIVPVVVGLKHQGVTLWPSWRNQKS